MNRKKFLLGLYKIVNLFELAISVVLIIGILISLPDIFKYYYHIIVTNEKISYELFQNFLSHVLLLVIAVEFVVLMVAHSDANIIHLIMLVIARKMLVYSDTMPDLLIAVIAIFILFAVRKYLLVGNIGEFAMSPEENVFSASVPIDLLNKKYGFRISSEDSETLGGHIAYLLNKQGETMEVGMIIDDGEYMYQIEKVSNGVMETISITSLSEENKNL